MDKKYLVLEYDMENPMFRRVFQCDNVGQAYTLWIEKPSNRIIVKKIEVEVKERGN